MNGPEPVVSSICLSAGVSATRLGMMNGTFTLGLPNACSIIPNGSRSRMRKVRASTASIASLAAISFCPRASRLPQRASEAITSSLVTGLPSWNSSPSRSVKVQTLRSLPTSQRCTICGCTVPCASVPNRVS
jgi:hypothetical protein